MKLYGLFGAGGFGREVMPLVEPIASKICSFDTKLEIDASFKIVFVVEGLKETTITNGFLTISDEDFINYKDDNKYFNVAIGNSKARERIVNKMKKVKIEPFDIISENTLSYDSNKIGEGCILCANTMITSNATIGKFFHSNLFSYVAHDCVLGDYVTFAPRVNCNGNVKIGSHAYIGTGAFIRQGITIGEGAVVGMGAVVTKDVAPYTTVVGNPAKVLRKSQ